MSDEPDRFERACELAEDLWTIGRWLLVAVAGTAAWALWRRS